MSSYLTAGPPPPKTASTLKRPPATAATGATPASKAKPTSSTASVGATAFLDPSTTSGGGGAGGKKGKKNRKLPNLHVVGTDQEFRKMVVTWLENLGLVAVAHERELCQIRRESNKVLAFEDECDELEAIENAKGLWDSKREPGKRHTDGAFRHIAAKCISHHLRMKIESSADLSANKDHLLELVDLLDTGAETVQRFYLIRIQDKDKDKDADKPTALLIMKYDLTTQDGDRAMGAWFNMEEEGVLHLLVSARLREDRAPMGNISKAIMGAMSKSTKA